MLNNIKKLGIQNLIFILIIVVTPGIFVPGVVESFEFPKNLFLITLFLLSSLLALKRTVDIKYLDLALIIFLIIYFISSLLSIDFLTSFFGYFGRFSGSFLFFLSLFIYLILNKEIIKKIKFKTIFCLILIGSIIPISISYLSIFNIFFTNTNRIYSTLGQPNWFANYLLVILFIQITYFLEKKRNINLLYFTFTFIPFIHTLSLASFIAFFTTLLIYSTFRYKKLEKIKFITLLIFILLTSLLHGEQIIKRVESQVFAFNPGRTIITNDTGKIRTILLKNTIEQTFETPKTTLIGVGPENFAYDFSRPEELNNTSEWAHLFNKPHNFFAEELFETGILGLTFYTLTFLTLIISVFYTISGIPLVAVFISLLGGWPTSYIYILIFLLTYKLITKEEIQFKLLNINFLNNNFKKLKPHPLLAKVFLEFLLVIHLVFSFSVVALGFNPCLSEKLLPSYQPFYYLCVENSGSSELLENAYNINPKNKIYAEKVLLSLLELSNIESADNILNNLLKEEPKNPIYIYYKGLIEEKKGNTEQAYIFYNTANNLVPNFFEANEKVRGFGN